MSYILLDLILLERRLLLSLSARHNSFPCAWYVVSNLQRCWIKASKSTKCAFWALKVIVEV